jgi:hypothetical protein
MPAALRVLRNRVPRFLGVVLPPASSRSYAPLLLNFFAASHVIVEAHCRSLKSDYLLLRFTFA